MDYRLTFAVEAHEAERAAKDLQEALQQDLQGFLRHRVNLVLTNDHQPFRAEYYCVGGHARVRLKPSDWLVKLITALGDGNLHNFLTETFPQYR